MSEGRLFRGLLALAHRAALSLTCLAKQILNGGKEGECLVQRRPSEEFRIFSCDSFGNDSRIALPDAEHLGRKGRRRNQQGQKAKNRLHGGR